MKYRSIALALVVAFSVCLQATSQQQPAAGAASPIYNVELIIFRATTALGPPENWVSPAEAPTTPEPAGGAADTSGESQTPVSPAAAAQLARFVQALPETQYRLNEFVTKLRQSGTYVPVAHVAWSQTASPWGTRSGFPVQRLGITADGLSGTVFLERGQFLHLGMSLSYAMPNPPSSLGAAPGTVFTINDSMRVRFSEPTYYDHPAFGVIALVTPAQGARPAGR